MNLIKFIPIAIFIFTSLMATSQENSDLANITWGESTKEKFRSKEVNVLGEIDGSSYVLTLVDTYQQVSKCIIEKYDTDLNLTGSSEFTLKKGKKNKLYLGSVKFNNKLYIFSSIIEKNGSSREKIYYRQTIDLESLKLNDDVSEIFTLKKKGLVGQLLSNFDFKNSSDKSKILFTYDIINDKSSRTTYKCNVYDNTFKKLYSKKVSLPDQEGTPEFFLANNGNLYTLNLDYVGKPRYKRKGEPNYNFIVTKYSELGENVEKIPVKVEGKDLLDMQISVKENGDLVCGGVYSSTNSFRADGVFFLTLDAETNEMKKQSLKDFESGFISNSARVNSNHAINKKEKGPDAYLFRYVFQYMHYFDDGSMVFVAEQYSEFSGGDNTANYYYGDLVIVKSSSNGEIEMVNKIPKYQDCFEADVVFGSYSAQVINDKLSFIFNDHMDNFGNSSDKLKVFMAARNNKSVVQTMDLDGNFERTSLSNVDEIGALLMPSSLIRVDEKESFIFAKNRQNKNQKMGKVTFN